MAPQGEAMFTAGYDSEIPVTFEWQFSQGNLKNATNQTLAISNVTHADAGTYRLRVQNSVGAVTSTVARLSVQPQLAPPEFVGATAVRVPFDSEPGRNVTLQARSNLTAPNWTTLGTTNSTLVRGAFIDATATDGQRYYRLRLEP